jgi:hypothetical protein
MALPPAPASAVADAPARFALARGKTSGEWVELQVADPADRPDRAPEARWRADSRYLSLDAMAFFHDAFARAAPGIDLFVPRLLEVAALRRLGNGLESLSKDLEATETLADAKTRWAPVSSLISGLPDEASWRAARVSLLGTIRELSALVAERLIHGDRLWVLGNS